MYSINKTYLKRKFLEYYMTYDDISMIFILADHIQLYPSTQEFLKTRLNAQNGT